MASRRIRLWLAVAVAIFALVAAVAYPVLRDLRVSTVSKFEGLEALALARAKFADDRPLVEITSDGWPHVRVNRSPDHVPRHPVHHLVVLTYDSPRERLIRTRVPLWAVQLGGWKNVFVRSVGLGDLQLTADDIRRHGPGLVADLRGPGERQTLLWAE